MIATVNGNQWKIIVYAIIALFIVLIVIVLSQLVVGGKIFDSLTSTPLLLAKFVVNLLSPVQNPEYYLYDEFDFNRPEVWIKSQYGGPHGTQFLPEFTFIAPYDSELVLLSDVNRHTGGQYESIEKYLYGKYVARMRIANTPGTTMAFFVYKGPEPAGHNEIDIEFLKKDGNTSVYFSTYVRAKQNSFVYNLSFDPGQAYHVYGFYWYKDRVEFYVDDMSKPVWISYEYIPDEPCPVLFNNWVFSGSMNTSSFPTETNVMHVDWVKIEKF